MLIATLLCCLGVEFGARMITIDSKQIKLQIWDTVSARFIAVFEIFQFHSWVVVLYCYPIFVHVNNPAIKLSFTDRISTFRGNGILCSKTLFPSNQFVLNFHK